MIITQETIKGKYEELFKFVKDAVLNNVYAKDTSIFNNVVIFNEEDEIVKLNKEEYEPNSMLREIKKQLIKHELYVTGFSQEVDTFVIHTTDNLLGLLYVPTNDEEGLSELMEIKEEILRDEFFDINEFVKEVDKALKQYYPKTESRYEELNNRKYKIINKIYFTEDNYLTFENIEDASKLRFEEFMQCLCMTIDSSFKAYKRDMDMVTE